MTLEGGYTVAESVTKVRSAFLTRAPATEKGRSPTVILYGLAEPLAQTWMLNAVAVGHTTLGL